MAGCAGTVTSMSRFGSVITAMVTPFSADGELDHEGAAELARWLVAQGNDALVLSGTTGEAACLTDEEQIALWRTVRAAVDVPLIAGSGTNDTRHAAELTSAAADAGMDAVLIVTPYYNRPSQAGIEAHFRHVCAATELPVIVYDIPVRTGRKIGSDLILRMYLSLFANKWVRFFIAAESTRSSNIERTLVVITNSSATSFAHCQTNRFAMLSRSVGNYFFQ